MTYTMTCEIVFPATARRGEIVLHRVTGLSFETSWKTPISKGSITLPRNVRFINQALENLDNPGQLMQQLFSRDDKVIVKFGYDGINITEFEGYVTSVSADIPVVIEFADEMALIRRLPVNFSAPNITLQELLETIIPGYEIDALEQVELGSVRLAQTQVGVVLEQLEQEWGLYTYWKNGKVRSGKYYVVETDSEVKNFHLERNCVSTALNYKRKEDIRLKIKAVSTLPDGSKIEIDSIGDIDGDMRQLTFYNVTDVKELEVLAQIEYERMKVDGFDGSFTAFGIPSVTHSQKCRLISDLFPERSGIYYIDGVRKTFGMNGVRQEIELGSKVVTE